MLNGLDGISTVLSRSQTPAESWVCVLRMMEESRAETTQLRPIFAQKNAALVKSGDELFGLTNGLSESYYIDMRSRTTLLMIRVVIGSFCSNGIILCLIFIFIHLKSSLLRCVVVVRWIEGLPGSSNCKKYRFHKLLLQARVR